MTQTIYLDYAATTPVDPRVAETLQQYLTPDGIFGNPASRSHAIGWQAEAAVEQARARVAELIGADSRELVWTSGATESDNLAIKGAAMANQALGRHVITSSIEHKAVVDCFQWLEERGFEVTWLEPDVTGCIAAEQVEAALREDTVLVSLMAVNNELGSINPIASIGSLLRERGVLFHVDAAQAAGKMVLDVSRMPVDLMALSAHKVYGPKGVGALYVRRSPKVVIEAQMHGGGHERGLRSGTLPTHQIAAMGHAFGLALEEGESEAAWLEGLRSRFVSALDGLEGVHVHGPDQARVPGIINIAFEGVDGESLLLALRGIAVSSGSACASATTEPSYVLQGIGLSPEMAQASLRFSLGRFSTESQIDTAAERITEAVVRLRERGAARRTTV
ncbi:aminotransferase class V-fold PLP-dependent enzyme [Halomonadaceae bacterium KBTZ08]